MLFQGVNPKQYDLSFCYIQNQIMKKQYRITTDDPPYLYTYKVRIISVKMKVKFQCKMRLQLDSQPITTQVPISDGSIFQFSQDCLLANKSIEEDCFSISISIITNKGAKYIAGIANVYLHELARAVDTGPSSRIVVMLSKCLDPEAVLQIVVKQSMKTLMVKNSPTFRQQTKSKFNRQQNIFSCIEGQSRKHEGSPQLSPRGYEYKSLHYATKSQVNLPRAIVSRVQETDISRVDTIHRGRSRSRKNQSKQKDRISIVSRPSLNYNNYGVPATERVRDSVDYVNQTSANHYKKSYSKLKQKLKKQEQQSQIQYEKRMNLQVAETQNRLQAIKFRIKCQQLEKNVNEKTQSISHLQSRIQELQRLLRGEPIEQKNQQKFFHVNMYGLRGNYQQKTAVTQNESLISALEIKVNTANRELQQFKSKVFRMNKTYNQKETALLRQLQSKSEKINKLEEQLRNRKNIFRNDDTIKLTLQSKQKMIGQYQKQLDEQTKKLHQADKTRRELEIKINQQANKIQQLNKNSNIFILERQKCAEDIEKQRNKANMAEFTMASLRKNLQKAENQIQNYKRFKQKYHDAVVEIKKLEGQKKLETRNYENANKMSINNLSIMQTKHKEQVDRLQKKNHQLQSKNREMSFRIKQLQEYTNKSVKFELENMKKLNEKLQRDCEQFKSLDRMTRKQYSSFESKINQLNSEIQMWKNKHKSQENLSKLENEKYVNEINRLKSSLQQSLVNQMSIKQKLQATSTELAINNNKMQNLEQKYTKQIKQLMSRVQMEVNKSNRLQQLLKRQQEVNQEVKEKEKQLISRIEQYGENQNQYSDLIKRYEGQLSKIKNMLAINEQKLQQKIQQSEYLSKQLKQTSQKYNALVNKSQQLGYQNRRCSSELQKQSKQKQKLQLQLTNIKMSNESKQKFIEKQKFTIQQQTKQKAQIKDKLNLMTSNIEALSKQYDRFKQQMTDILIREFAIDGLHKYTINDIKIRGHHSGYKEPLTKNTTQGDLFNMRSSPRQMIGRYGQDNKMTKSVYALPSANNNMHGSIGQANNNEIINSVIQFSRESKSLINKLNEQYRLLQKDFEYSKQNWLQKESSYSQELKRSEKTISELQDQLSAIFQQKQQISNKLKDALIQSKQENLKLKKQLQKSMQKLQQSIFVNNGLMMEKENEKEYYEMKINQQNGTILKLQYSISGVANHNAKIQNELKKVEQAKEEIERQLRKCQEEHDIKQKKIKELQIEKGGLLKYSQQINAKSKQHVGRISELELLLSSEREKNNKNLQLISSEQKKLMDSKDFVNNLIKQKQMIVKQQIQNGKRIVQLQSIKFNLQHELQLQREKMEVKCVELSNEKQRSKKASEQAKELQLQKQSINAIRLKLSQQIKQKDREIALLSQNMKSKQAKMQRELSQRVQQLNQINNNKQLMQRINSQQIESLKKEIKGQQQQIRELKQQIKNVNNAKVALEIQIENLNKKIQQNSFEINSYKQVQLRLIGARDRNEQQVIKITEQLHNKQEELYSATGQIYSLQQRYKKRILQLEQQNQNLLQQYDYKFDNMCQDYQTKIDEMERQRDYLKKKLQIAEDQVNKNQNRIRELQNDQSKQRQLNKDTISKIEEEKSHTVNGLKSENKKIIQLKDKLESQVKRKDTEIQRLKSIEVSSKSLIFKLEQKLKESQIKIQQIQNLLNEQSQIQKKRQLMIKQYEESIKNYQWVLERQIKKELQNLTKSVIGIVSQNSQAKRKITEFIKQLDNKVSRVITDKINPLPVLSRTSII